MESRKILSQGGRFNGIVDPLGGHVISPYNVNYLGIRCPFQFSRRTNDNTLLVYLTRLLKTNTPSLALHSTRQKSHFDRYLVAVYFQP